MFTTDIWLSRLLMTCYTAPHVNDWLWTIIRSLSYLLFEYLTQHTTNSGICLTDNCKRGSAGIKKVHLGTEKVWRLLPVGATTNQSQWRIQERCAPGARPSLRTKIFSISCSFWKNPANLYVGAPSPKGLAPPPTENPVSAPESACQWIHKLCMVY